MAKHKWLRLDEDHIISLETRKTYYINNYNTLSGTATVMRQSDDTIFTEVATPSMVNILNWDLKEKNVELLYGKN